MSELDISNELFKSYCAINDYVNGINPNNKESIEELYMLNGLLRDILNAMSFYYED